MKKILFVVLCMCVCGLFACGEKEYKGVEDSAGGFVKKENTDKAAADVKAENSDDEEEDLHYASEADNPVNTSNVQQYVDKGEQIKEKGVFLNLLYRENNPKKALDLINQCIKNGDSTSDIYLARAVVYSELEDYSNALKDFDKVKQKDRDKEDNMVGFYIKRAFAKYKTGDIKGAIGDYTTYIDLFDRDIENKSGGLIGRLAGAYEYRGKVKEEAYGKNDSSEKDRLKAEELYKISESKN